MKNQDVLSRIISLHTSDYQPSKLIQPFPMQGSKRKQAPLIARLVPDDAERLFEPFCGSAAVSLEIAQRGFQGPICIGDANQDITTLWQAIIEEPNALANGYEHLWLAQFETTESPRDYFLKIRDRYNAANVKHPEEFLFILNRIVKGALRYNSLGKINQSADSRRFGAKPAAVNKRITFAHSLLKNATVFSGDWLRCLDTTNESDIVYLDPPYQGTTDTRDKRYSAGLPYEEFVTGVGNLVQRNISAIISYDAVAGPVTYGKPLYKDVDLLTFDIITGVSSQGTLLGRSQESHEALYVTPALVKRLGGVDTTLQRVKPVQVDVLFDTLV